MVLRNFIVFEGIDGAGTSTQINMLSERSEADKFYFTAEPSHGPTGRFLRTMLKGDVKLDPRTAAYLFAADRAEHLWGTSAEDGNIVNVAKSGKIVVSDRYFFSSLAYQSIDCGNELPRLLNSPFPLPELLFFFDIEPEVSLKRIGGRGFTEIYEKLDFLRKTEAIYKAVMNEYDRTAKGETMKIIRLDATQSPELVAKNIWSHLEKLPILKA